MTALRRACTAGIVALFGVVLAAPAAFAEGEVAIDHVEVDGDRISMLLSTDGVPAGASVDPSTLTVEVGAKPVEARTKSVAAGDISRTTVLVLDASNSMRRAGKFAAATQAVNAFLDAAPDDVAIGLVTFAGKVAEPLPPTTDHDAVRAALQGVSLGKGTAVYDGVLTGVDLAGDEGSRSLLVLSDGGDTSSATTLDVAAGQAKDAGIIVDVVSLAKGAKAQELAAAAEMTEGSVIPAETSALQGVFSARADALSRQLLVTFETPEGVGEEADIDVAVEAGGTVYRDSAFVALPRGVAAPDVVESGKALVSKPFMLLGALALALGLAGLLGTVLVGATDTRSVAARRLDAYFEAGDGKVHKGRRKSDSKTDLKDSAVAVADKVVSADLETRISQRLAGAGSALTASEWLLLHAGIAIGSAAVVFMLFGPGLAVLGFVAGVVLPWIYLKWRHARRLNAFNGQLAQTLGLMAGGLQAGLSLPQAIDAVVREGHQPMSGELNRALVEQRLGIDITDAMESVGLRMESPDFGWVVMAIRIQREVGGNLAEILHTVADTLREREYLRRQVKALSAEGRLSGYILTGLPPLIFFYMMFANPEYVALLYTTTPGFVLLGLAFLLLGLGSFMMSKLSKVEV